MAISSGWRHSCAIRTDGVPRCWGFSSLQATSPPQGEHFIAVSTGYEYTCALRENGTPVCWGQIPFADGPQTNRFGQASPPQNERFTAISSGTEHSCGLRKDGKAVCWGRKWSNLVRLPRRDNSSVKSTVVWVFLTGVGIPPRHNRHVLIHLVSRSNGSTGSP